MALLIGDVRADDEFMHPVSDDPHFSENMLFTFFEQEGSIGGFARIGNRANEGRAEVTLCMFLPDGRVAFEFLRPPIVDNSSFNAGGMKFEVLKPTELIRTEYNGTATVLDDPGQMSEPSVAFRNNPKVRAGLMLEHSAVSSLFLPMPAHYEQHMHARGKLELAGDVFNIDAYGVRDHTWGRRNWQATLSDRTLWCTFGRELGFTLSVTWHERDAEPEVMGSVIRGDVLHTIVRATVDSQYEQDGLTHTGFVVKTELDTGEELTFTGRTKSLMPLRNRRGGKTTYIGQGMTEYRCGDLVAYGLSEYMDLIE